MVDYNPCTLLFFFFNDTATTEIYTLSLHDALPISPRATCSMSSRRDVGAGAGPRSIPSLVSSRSNRSLRSEEHTSELQSLRHLVCRLLLEKKRNSMGRITGMSARSTDILVGGVRIE